jgi:GrpB protein
MGSVAGSDDWPAWAIETVSVVEPDEEWPRRAAEERRRLLDLLGPWLVDDIHHVGSTAVPGLPAKPIVDLIAGVRSLDDAAEIARVLAPRRAGLRTWRLLPAGRDCRGLVVGSCARWTRRHG